MKKLIGLFALLALAGCATSPLPAEDADLVPGARLYSFQRASDGGAGLTVTRDTGFTGSACNAKLFINGRLAAEIGTGETASFHVPSGDLIVGVQSCASGLKEREGVLKDGQNKRYRISIDSSMSLDISPTTF